MQPSIRRNSAAGAPDAAVRRHAWPAARVAEALALTARRHGLRGAAPPTADAWPAGGDDGNPPVAALAGAVGLEAEAVETRYDEIDVTLRSAAPALVRVEAAGEPCFLVVLRGGARQLGVLGPDHRLHRVPLAAVRAALRAPIEAPEAAATERLLATAGLPAHGRARAALLEKRAGGRRIGGIWLLQLPPSAPFLPQLRQAGLVRRLCGLLGAHAVQYLLWILFWYVAGLTALQGRNDGGWFWALALLLATLVPLRLLVLHAQGTLSLDAGALLKRRLMAGALKLEIDRVRAQGTGQFLGRVIESNAVETLAPSGGLNGLIALVELVGAASILVLGAGGFLHAGVLAAWLAVTALLAWRYYRAQSAWATIRLAMTHGLVEQMVGHRTRLAQRRRELWHAGEDGEAEGYLDASRHMDRAAARLIALVPRGWLIVGMAALSHAFVLGTTPGALAVGLGGTLLAYQALRRLSMGLVHLTGAAVAWRQVAPLFHAAADGAGDAAAPAAAAATGASPRRARPGETVLDARGLTFGYPESGRAVLRESTLRVRCGDRLLLEGPSGGGKSTLAALLAGLREPHAGLLLLNGLDARTLGTAGWRRRVASAPQFHENHVLSGSFAFNLLLGRRWPPTERDLEEAEALCRELGLGPLLDRMPAGMHQMVGETGWQLSHGEKSRLFLARALLQDVDLVLLDESFGALDPENTARSMRCVLERAPTLMVIAHP